MFYALTRIVVLVLFRVLWRPVVVGREHIPATGPLILASNHLSFIDSIVIPLAVPRRVVFLAKAEYWEGRSLASLPRRLFFRTFDAVPVRRDQQGDAPGLAEPGPGGARPRRRVRDLPRGHPVPGRPPLPRADRRRLAGAGAGRGRARGAGRDRPGAADRRDDAAGPPGAGVLRPAGAPRGLRRGRAPGRARREITDAVMDRWPSCPARRGPRATTSAADLTV